MIKDMIKFAIVLFVVGAIAGVILGYVYGVTKESIKKANNESKIKAIKLIFGESENDKSIDCDFESLLPVLGKEDEKVIEKVDAWQKEKDSPLYFKVTKDKQHIGYAAIGSKRGYSSDVQEIVGVDLNFTFKSLVIIASNETPGLGENMKTKPALYTWGDLLSGQSDKRKQEKIEALKKANEPLKNIDRPVFQTQFKEGMTRDEIAVDKDGGKIVSMTGATITSRAVCQGVQEALDKIKERVEKNNKAKEAGTK